MISGVSNKRRSAHLWTKKKDDAMNIRFDPEGSVAGLQHALDEVTACEGMQSLIILCCDHNQFCPTQLDPLLKQQTLPLIGGVFPQIIYGQACFERGSIVVGLTQQMTVHTIQHLCNSEIDLQAQLLTCLAPNTEHPPLSVVLFDTLATRLSALMDGLFTHLGLNGHYIGGGVGSMSLQPTACLLSQAGMLQQAALIAQIDMISGVGIAHGWQPLSRAMKATRVEGTHLLELNYQPAFTVYRRILEYYTGQVIDPENFFELSKFYPLGIRKLDSEMIMRLPLMLTADGLGLVCTADIPEHAFVYVAHGQAEHLLAAADLAQLRAKLNVPMQHQPPAQLVFDCVSRLAFFGADIGDELAVLSNGQPMFGAFSMGEIANNGRECLELHSMATAVAYLDISS
jgi:hypothetical protein